jgi:hypothetical protein
MVAVVARRDARQLATRSITDAISTRPPLRTHPRCTLASLHENKEDDMTTTLTRTCSFCGLAFANRPMLELHIREDHVQRGQAAERGQDDHSGARGGRLHAGGPDRERGEPAGR